MQPNITQAIMAEIFDDDIPDEALEILKLENVGYEEKITQLWNIRRSDKYLRDFGKLGEVDR